MGGVCPVYELNDNVSNYEAYLWNLKKPEQLGQLFGVGAAFCTNDSDHIFFGLDMCIICNIIRITPLGNKLQALGKRGCLLQNDIKSEKLSAEFNSLHGYGLCSLSLM